jgi:hypothetical protein
MFKPMDSLIFYLGGVAGPEQADYIPVPSGFPASAPFGPGSGHLQGADSHWRELGDLVIDFNPSSAVNIALNADIDHEDNIGGSATVNETWWGVSAGAKFVVADPFAIAVRGEVFSDNNSNIIIPNMLVLPVPGTGTALENNATTIESATLTLSYVIASHLTLMLDNRADFANNAIFPGSTQNNAPASMTNPAFASLSKTLFTTTLGAIITTK